MKITNANNCKKWAKDLCDCNYLSQCEMNKQQSETITLDGETFVHNPDSKQRLDIVQPLNPNANAIKVIEQEISELEKVPIGWLDSERLAVVNYLKHILKLIQS